MSNLIWPYAHSRTWRQHQLGRCGYAGRIYPEGMGQKVDTKNREDVDDGITLSQWGKVIINRKLKSNKPGTASWYTGAIRSITKLNWGRDLRLNEITVTLLTNFQIAQEAKGNSKNGVRCYLRAIRSLYNSAIREDQLYTKKPISNIIKYQLPDEPKKWPSKKPIL